MSWVVTDGLQRAIRVFLALISVLLGWLLAASVEAAATAPAHAEPGPGHACDGHHHTSLATYTTTDRGPPLYDYTHATAPRAVGHWPHGSLARPGITALRPTTTYTTPAKRAHVAEGAATTEGPVGGSPGSPSAVSGTSVAAESESGLVNLATEGRTTHILDGDATGGGHAWPGLAGKTPFPESWSRGQIMHAISDIATDPAAWENVEYQGSRAVLYGTRDGVEIKVVVSRSIGDIITGHPINLPRNP